MGSIIVKAKNLNKIVEESYITKVGNKLTKTAEEVSIYTTEGSINMYSNTSIDIKGEEGTTLGEYQEPPILKEIINTKFIAAVRFYRSIPHTNGEYGTKDKNYKGTFGFDSFDSKVHAEGMSQYYQKLSSILPKKKELSKNVYFCPYISLWPPQKKENPSLATSKITLYLKAEEATTKIDQKGKIILKSSDPRAIKVTTSPLELEIEGAPIPITIECLNTFSSEIYITVCPEGDPAKKIGKLIVYPNKVRYKTVIQPVEVKFASKESKIIKSKTHESFFHGLEKEFNKTSFNQAYIHAELAQKTHQITLSKTQFSNFFTKEADGKLYLIKKNESDSLTEKYNNLIENRFAALLQNKVSQNKSEEKLKVAIENLLIAFDNEYKGKGKVEKLHKKKIITNAWRQPKVQKTYQDYQNALKTYQNTGKAGVLNKTNIIHIFYSRDIHAARNPSNKVLAYSKIAEGVVHIFEAALITKKPYPDVLHEIGHSLGLKHTFSEDLGEYQDRQPGKIYKEDIKKKCELLKTTIKNKETIIKKITNNNLFNFYKDLEDATQNKNWFLKDINNINFHFLDKINDAIAFEKHPFSPNNLTQITKLNTELTQLKIKLKKKQQEKATDSLQSYPNSKSQSNTLENYMDYTQPQGSSAKNPSVERKVFYKWQWDIMRNNSPFLTPIL